MNIKINSKYLVLSADTIEDSAKIAIISEQLKQQGYLHSYMTYSTLEIPLQKINKKNN